MVAPDVRDVGVGGAEIGKQQKDLFQRSAEPTARLGSSGCRSPSLSNRDLLVREHAVPLPFQAALGDLVEDRLKHRAQAPGSAVGALR